MYTLLITGFFCIPKTLAASKFPVSTQSVCTNCSFFSRITVPIGFCCGGFSSTAGYVPGNEAHLAMSDFCSPLRWFLAEKCFPFLSGKLQEKLFQLFPSEHKPFGFDAGRNSNFFPSFVTLKRCVTAPLASPCTGQMPVSIFDCVLDSTLIFFLVNRQSNRKYFKFYPYFTGFFLHSCGKLCALPVEKTVENPASDFNI